VDPEQLFFRLLEFAQRIKKAAEEQQNEEFMSGSEPLNQLLEFFNYQTKDDVRTLLKFLT
jgi:hypothetical protein